MFAIVDLETTGGSAQRDRITEVAIILHDGQRRVSEYSTLINPEVPIPVYITDITNIDDHMVADAPTFSEVARDIHDLLQDTVFVAHNVNFDYGFLREAFERVGLNFRPKRMCTVKTSRKFIPGLGSYSLGNLCRHLGISNHARHRAMGDADATTHLLEYLFRVEPGLRDLALDVDPYSEFPAAISRQQLQALPEVPGLYFFFNEKGQTLHAAKSKNIRRDALKKLKAASKVRFEVHQVRDISWEATGSELLAQLRMPGEMHKRAPGFAASLRLKKYRAGIFSYFDQRNYLRLYVGPLRKGQRALAEFPNVADAEAALLARVRKHGLCGELTGLDDMRCQNFQCDGACRGEMTAAEYNQRVNEALNGIGFPFPSFFLLGNGRRKDEVSVVCIEEGNCVGYAYLDATVGWSNPDMVRGLLRPFTHLEEAGKIVRQYLPKIKQAQIVPF